MAIIQTTTLKKILQMKGRIKILQGGSSSSKTFSTLIYLIDRAQSAENKVISVVSESQPHLRLGSIRDFLNIMRTQNYFKDDQWNKALSTYTFESGSIIEFFSADSGKATGPRRDILFLNEANHIPYPVYEQLEIRTNEEIIIDYNPTGEFWVHSEVIPYHDHDFLKVTYKDNEALPESVVKTIEARKHNTAWWRVYGLGEMGEKEGQIYVGWKQIKGIPSEARLERLGLDLGFTNDPSALVAIYRYNDAFILDEVLFEKGQTNSQLAEAIDRYLRVKQASRNVLTVVDSAEPKTIADLKSRGIAAIGAQKGRDSVNSGIQVIQDQQIYVTDRSVNVWKAFYNYMWKIDKMTGKPINTPNHDFSDAMDAVRYGLTDLIKPTPFRDLWRIS